MARTGKGTQLRFAILTGGSTSRPVTADLDLLTGVQTSEISGGQDIEEVESSGDYETTASAQPNWQDGDTVRTLSWSFSLTARAKDTSTQAGLLRDIWTAWAAGQQIWVERLRVGDTHWRGGRAIITDPSEPVAWDGELTFSCSFRGQGALTDTAVTP